MEAHIKVSQIKMLIISYSLHTDLKPVKYRGKIICPAPPITWNRSQTYLAAFHLPGSGLKVEWQLPGSSCGGWQGGGVLLSFSPSGSNHGRAVAWPHPSGNAQDTARMPDSKISCGSVKAIGCWVLALMSSRPPCS